MLVMRLQCNLAMQILKTNSILHIRSLSVTAGSANRVRRQRNPSLLNFHALRVPFSASLLLDESHKVIQHTRPGAILTPPPKELVLLCLRIEAERHCPHVLIDPLLPLRLEELNVVIQPGSCSGVPGYGRACEEQTPVLDRGVQHDGFLAGISGNLEGVVVNALEKLLVIREVRAEFSD